MKQVLIRGIAGNMGQQAAETVLETEGFGLAAGVDRNTEVASMADMTGISGGPSAGIESDIRSALEACEEDIDIVIDFTSAQGLLEAVETGFELGLDFIIGTTGLDESERLRLEEMTEAAGRTLLLAPNFSLGAVLLMEMASKASEYFPRVEIIEGHHENKEDAPSGTSIATAEKMLNTRPFSAEEDIEFAAENVRGGSVNDVRIHSLRLPGMMAQQEVLLGGEGQILSLKHEARTREAFRPGIRLALKELENLEGYNYGLQNLL